jgi:hypothetical protein
MTEEATDSEALIKIKRENYVTARTSTGGKSLHNNDDVAQGLAGLNVDELYQISGKFLAFPLKVSKVAIEDVTELESAYEKLNVGMQRMNLGNRIRARVTKIDAENAKAAAADVKDEKPVKERKSGADQLAKILAPFVKAAAKREADATKAKEAAAKEAKKVADAAAKTAAKAAA